MYAVYPRKLKGMIELNKCILVDEEYQAQWQCILDPSLTYKEIKTTKGP